MNWRNQHECDVATNATLTALGCFAAGAGLMYLFDPARGALRRGEARNRAVRGVNETGTGLRRTAQHLRNCAALPMFSEFHRDCPNARAAARELVLLPTYSRYPASEVKRNIEIIREFFSAMIYGAPKETASGVSRA